MYIKKSFFSLYLFLPEIPVESRGNSQNDYRMDNIPVIPAALHKDSVISEMVKLLLH